MQGSYVPIHLGKNSAAALWDPLPRTDRVWADLVELPCEPEVSLHSVKKIAALVKATIARCRESRRPSHSVIHAAAQDFSARRNAGVCANQQ